MTQKQEDVIIYSVTDGLLSKHTKKTYMKNFAHFMKCEQTDRLMSKRFIKIYPSLQELIVSLRRALVMDDWKLERQQTSYNDLLDAFRLACLNYELPKSSTS